MSFFKLSLSKLIGSEDSEDMKTADVIYVYSNESHLNIWFKKTCYKTNKVATSC